MTSTLRAVWVRPEYESWLATRDGATADARGLAWVIVYDPIQGVAAKEWVRASLREELT